METILYFLLFHEHERVIQVVIKLFWEFDRIPFTMKETRETLSKVCPHRKGRGGG